MSITCLFREGFHSILTLHFQLAFYYLSAIATYRTIRFLSKFLRFVIVSLFLIVYFAFFNISDLYSDLHSWVSQVYGSFTILLHSLVLPIAFNYKCNHSLLHIFEITLWLIIWTFFLLTLFLDFLVQNAPLLC